MYYFNHLYDQIQLQNVTMNIILLHYLLSNVVQRLVVVLISVHLVGLRRVQIAYQKKKKKTRSVQIVLLVLLLSLLFQIGSMSAIISFSSLLDFQGGKKRCTQSRNLFIYFKYYTTCSQCTQCRKKNPSNAKCKTILYQILSDKVLMFVIWATIDATHPLVTMKSHPFLKSCS